MSLKFKGIVDEITQEETFGENGRKRSLALTEARDAEYKQSLSVDFMGDKIELLEGVKKGDVVTVKFSTRTKKSEDGRYFNSIKGWSLDVEDEKANDEEEDDVF